MKKAFKISAVVMALVVVAALAVAFSVGAAPTELDSTNFRTEIEKGGEFKLTADIGNLSDTEVIRIGENVVLDLNGHTITSGYADKGLFYQVGVANPGTFKIIDSVGGGAIIAPNTALLHNVGGTVRIEGGTIVTAALKDPSTTATVTIKGSGAKGDGSNKGTWISFTPSNIVYGYEAISETSPANADAIYRVIPKVYTITYELPNGATHTNATEYTIESNNIVLTDGVASGYTFTGWYIKEDGAEQKVNTIVAATHLYDITIVGRFVPTVYDINYNLADGEENAISNPGTFDVTQPDIKLADATKLGNTFDGWYDAPVGGNRVYSIPCSTTYNDVNLYPRFTTVDYKINYVLYGGTNDASNPATYTVNDAVTFKDAGKTGYKFDGWYDAPVEGTKVTEIKAGTTGDVTLYAVYSTIEYTITYDFNGKTVTNEIDLPTGYNYETPTFTIPNAEVAPGVTFEGWYVDENNNDQIDDTEVRLDVVAVGSYGNLDLIAKWSDTQYKLFYYFGTGISSSNINNSLNTVEYFTAFEKVTLYAASRAYYDFDGWYTDPELTVALGSNATETTPATEWYIPEGTTNNVTVYAKWKATDYTITYDPNGYMWEVEKDADGNYVFDANGDFVLVYDAMGNKIPVTLPAGSTLENAPETYTWVNGVQIPSPSRPGYAFVGWYDKTTDTLLAPNSEGVYVIAPESRNGNIELVAEWTVGKYDVTIQYQYNDDYYAANKEIIDALPKGRIFWEQSLTVVYDTAPTHTVDFTKYNGFVPAAYTVEITNEDMLAGEPVIVYFMPVVLSTNYTNGQLVVTYYDGSKKTVDINSLASVKLQDSSLIYVTADGTETPVASIPTTADMAELQKTISDLNDSLTKINGDLTKKMEDLDAATAAKLNELKASIATNLTKIEQNANDIKDLQTQVADLQAQIDALDGTDGTLLVIAIIAAVLAAIAVIGVAVLFFKKK